LDPIDKNCGDPMGHSNGETGPREYQILLRVFEDFSRTQPQYRTLEDWLYIAQSQDLKYHSWIDEYLLASDAIGASQASAEVGNMRSVAEHAEFSEEFFPAGSDHDAYLRLRKILQTAKSKFVIIDSYVDGSLFTMLKTNISTKMSIEVLTTKIPPDFELERTKFTRQYPQFSVIVKRTKEIHDRFIIVDYTQYYHLGASVKDAGNKAFMLKPVENSIAIENLKQQFNSSWSAAKPA
jgi:hypothetical protein